MFKNIKMKIPMYPKCMAYGSRKPGYVKLITIYMGKSNTLPMPII